MSLAKRQAAIQRDGERKQAKFAKQRQAIKPDNSEPIAVPPVYPELPTTYKTYIKSAYWRAFRISILAQRGSTCQDCGDHRHPVQVHHLNYMRLMRELPTDVRVLCDPCHRKRHGKV